MQTPLVGVLRFWRGGWCGRTHSRSTNSPGANSDAEGGPEHSEGRASGTMRAIPPSPPEMQTPLVGVLRFWRDWRCGRTHSGYAGHRLLRCSMPTSCNRSHQLSGNVGRCLPSTSTWHPVTRPHQSSAPKAAVMECALMNPVPKALGLRHSMSVRREVPRYPSRHRKCAAHRLRC
jgi:hypothetical protein